jgi:hypothetical protein
VGIIDDCMLEILGERALDEDATGWLYDGDMTIY